MPVPARPDAAFFGRPEVARSKEGIPGGGGTVPESDPTTSVRTTYRVKAITGNVIEVEVTVKRNTRSQGGEPGAAPLTALAGAGLVGLLLARRRA